MEVHECPGSCRWRVRARWGTGGGHPHASLPSSSHVVEATSWAWQPTSQPCQSHAPLHWPLAPGPAPEACPQSSQRVVPPHSALAPLSHLHPPWPRGWVVWSLSWSPPARQLLLSLRFPEQGPRSPRSQGHLDTTFAVSVSGVCLLHRDMSPCHTSV